MLFTGIILGPHVLGLLDDKILSISSELRQMALIIILLKKVPDVGYNEAQNMRYQAGVFIRDVLFH